MSPLSTHIKTEPGAASEPVVKTELGIKTEHLASHVPTVEPGTDARCLMPCKQEHSDDLDSVTAFKTEQLDVPGPRRSQRLAASRGSALPHQTPPDDGGARVSASSAHRHPRPVHSRAKVEHADETDAVKIEDVDGSNHLRFRFPRQYDLGRKLQDDTNDQKQTSHGGSDSEYRESDGDDDGDGDDDSSINAPGASTACISQSLSPLSELRPAESTKRRIGNGGLTGEQIELKRRRAREHQYMYERRRKAKETPEQRKARLARKRIYNQRAFAKETPEHRAARLKQKREYMRNYIANETPERRAARSQGQDEE